MLRKVQSFWNNWEGTAVGKAAKDYGFYILATIVYVAVDASFAYVSNNEASLTKLFGPYGAILVTGAGKSLSYLRDRLQDPRVPNTPADR